MRRLALVVLGLAACTLPACFKIDYVVSVRPDGSGTLTVTSAMSTAQLDMIKQMASSFGDEAKTESPNPFSAASVKKDAAKMGEGVSLVRVEEFTKDGWAGSHAIYSFKDVTKLKLKAAPDGPGGGKSSSPFDKLDMSFRPAGAGPARLTLDFPESEDAKKAGGDAEPADEDEGSQRPASQDLAMAKQFLGGLRISMSIKPEGSISSVTGATERAGAVPIFEMDFDKLFENPEAFEKLALLKGEPDFESASKMVNGIDGITVPTAQTIVIEFK